MKTFIEKIKIEKLLKNQKVYFVKTKKQLRCDNTRNDKKNKIKVLYSILKFFANIFFDLLKKLVSQNFFVQKNFFV